ncbi:hypothetical protein BDQ12DRAFT_679658, partial [Crucibulum laeve]
MFCIMEENETNKYMGITGFANKFCAKNRRGEFIIRVLLEFWRKRLAIGHGFQSFWLYHISLGRLRGMVVRSRFTVDC